MTALQVTSGAEVNIAPASWKDAKALKKAIEREVAGSGIDIENPNSLVSTLLLKLDGSDAIDAALWPCLAVCTRNKARIVESTFDEVEARQDYYEIVLACVKENLSPLAGSLFSKLAGLGEALTQAAAAQASS